MSSGVLVALLILAGSPQPQNPPELISVLHRATEYVANYEAELGNLIGSEEYVQDATWLSTTTRGGYPTVVNRSRRRVSSDLLIIQVGSQWAAVRKVNRVDGVKVKEVAPPFEDAFDNSPEANTKRLLNMKAESTRYNIGDITREVNLPTFALKVLRKSEISRFAFARAGSTKIEGIQTWALRFKEQAGPTLVRGGKGELLYSNGTLWIEPETGRVLRTEFTVENPSAPSRVQARIVVAYSEEKNLKMFLPRVMDEHYEAELQTVNCKAFYSRFRPFEVDVRFEIHPPVQ